jgi:hypothetical protein
MTNLAERGFCYFCGRYLGIPKSVAHGLWQALCRSEHPSAVAIVRGWKLSTALGYQERAFFAIFENVMCPLNLVEALESLERSRRLPTVQTRKIVDRILERTGPHGQWLE